MAEAEEITCITTNAYSLDADEYVTELYELAFLGKFRLRGLNLLIEGIFSVLQWCKTTLCFFYSLVQGAQHQYSVNKVMALYSLPSITLILLQIIIPLRIYRKYRYPSGYQGPRGCSVLL